MKSYWHACTNLQRIQECQAPQQQALANSAGASHKEGLSLKNSEAEISYDNPPLQLPAQIPDFQHRSGHQQGKDREYIKKGNTRSRLDSSSDRIGHNPASILLPCWRLGSSLACQHGKASSKTISGVMHPFMQILSQYLGPQEAQLYSELQSKAKPVIKLSEETKNKLEAETGDKKLAAVIVNLRDYIRK